MIPKKTLVDALKTIVANGSRTIPDPFDMDEIDRGYQQGLNEAAAIARAALGTTSKKEKSE